MQLTVLSVAYTFAPVGPHAVGGAEQILSALDYALVNAGHTSLVLACEGSKTAGKLFPTPQDRTGPDDESRRLFLRNQFQAAMNRAVSTQHIDLIHMHGLDFHEYRLPTDIPVLVTLHLPVAWYPPEIWTKCPKNVQFQCVSDTQRRSFPPDLRDVLVVENGVILPKVEGERSDFAIALGRVCPEKNLHAALEAGTLAGTRVLLGGEIFPYSEHQKYFHEKIEPLLKREEGSVTHEFLGPLCQQQKEELLQRARCLLHPTLAPETSSLVAMEALAAGTPVIAYRSGALPEIVEDGVTGFLVDSVEEMATAIGRVQTISPGVCRAVAQRRFSRERMVREYLCLYRELIALTRRGSFSA
jgi:glycosyltransferase involved in cell wall biosynthesis